MLNYERESPDAIPPQVVQPTAFSRQLVVLGPTDELEDLESRGILVRIDPPGLIGSPPLPLDNDVREQAKKMLAPYLKDGDDAPLVYRRMQVVLDEGIPVEKRRYALGRGVTVAQAEEAVLALTFSWSDPILLAGDQHTVGGSPAGPHATYEDWVAQWALGAGHGMDEHSVPDVTSGVPYTGDGVVVGIFDTSYFPIGVTPTDVPLHWDSGYMLTVRHPELWEQVAGTPVQTIGWTARPLGAAPCPDHGQSIASLVQRVAPRSTIELIRVLSPYVIGDAQQLATEIIAFVVRVQNAGVRAVINLSLHVIPKAGMPWPTALIWAIAYAIAKRVIVVGAAGNNSQAEEAPEDAQFPASLADVVSVEARDSTGCRAWFSHSGLVSAPGTGLVGMVDNQPPCSAGYQWLSGTSYATAIVSGLAALILEKAVKNGIPISAAGGPGSNVRRAITGGLKTPAAFGGQIPSGRCTLEEALSLFT